MYLKQVCVAEGGTEAEDVLSFGMFGDRLKDSTIHDDEVPGAGLHVAAPLAGFIAAVLRGIAGIKEHRRPLQAHPVSLPSSFPGQLDPVLLSKQPLLHAQEPTGYQTSRVAFRSG